MRLATLVTAALLLLFCGADPLAAQAVRSNQGFQSNVLPQGDDGPSSPPTALGFTINFFQRQFSTVFINHNGNITFDGDFGEFTPEPISGLPVPIIAPFWADVDTRGTGTITYGRGTVNGRAAFGVTWNAVGYWDSRTDKTNTFQVVLIDRSDTGEGNFDIEMNYGRIVWEVGEFDYSQGISGSNGVCLAGPPACIPASAGYSNGFGASFSIAGSLVPGAFLDNSSTALIRRTLNSEVPGRLLFEARGGQVQQDLITSLSPSSRGAGSGDFDLTINGRGFTTAAQVLFGDATLSPLSVSPAQIVVRIASSLIQTPGQIPVRIVQAGSQSNTVTFTVTSGGPVLTSLSPASATAGSAAFDLTLNGSGFAQGASVLFGPTMLTPASVTAGQIVVRVTANLIQLPETIQVRVRQGGVDTAPLNFAVTTTPVPSISSLSPSSRTAGSEGFDLTITGVNFTQGATVLFGDSTLTPRSTGATEIVVAVPANLLQTPRTVPVRVRQGSVDSNSVNFTVTTAPVPSISSLSPSSRTAGSGGFDLTITGVNFTQGAVVLFGDSTLTPRSVSAAEIVAEVAANLIQTPGTIPVLVRQGQVDSNSVSFTVAAASVPVISSLSPTSREANSGDFQLTITGSNFVPGALVQFGGDTTLTPASLTSTQIVVNVDSSQIPNPGDYYVTVVQNQAQSNSLAFIVTPRPIVIPPVDLSGGGTSVNPGGSGNLSLSLQGPAPVALTGTLALNFTPDAAGLPEGYRDPALQFVAGGTALTFTIPSGESAAILPNGGAFNAGTVAGTITFTMTGLEAAGASHLPSPAPASSVSVARIAPVITPNSVRIVNTATGFNVELQGYSTPRDLQQARFTFSVSPTASLEGGATLTVDVTSAFTNWFGGAAGRENGSRFFLTMPFTVTGDANLIQSVSVALTNSVGTSTAVSGGR